MMNQTIEELYHAEARSTRREEGRKELIFFLCASAPLREVFFVFFLFLATALHAQQPRIQIQTSPDRLFEGSTFTLTVLVNHDNPDEVNVLAPSFPDSLLLEQMVKAPRLINDNTERWTAIEFRFTPTSPGTVSFEPFTVITPQGQTKTAPVNIVVYRAGAGGNTEATLFRLSWEDAPASMKVGDTAIIALRVNGWKNTALLPASGQFLPPVPPGHIIESLPISEKEKSSGIALKMRVIPLQTGVLTITNRRLTIENAIYEVPTLRINVSKAETRTEKP
jgi:hypothetical protein